jgi:hypothetical protein
MGYFHELVSYLKKNPDSKITADLQLKRTKCPALIKNMLAKRENNLLITDLQKVMIQYRTVYS